MIRPALAVIAHFFLLLEVYPGQLFRARLLVGYLDSIDQMHTVYDTYNGQSLLVPVHEVEPIPIGRVAAE